MQAHQMRVPKSFSSACSSTSRSISWSARFRWSANLADVFWKSKTKNFALLERHAAAPRALRPGRLAVHIGIVCGGDCNSADPVVRVVLVACMTSARIFLLSPATLQRHAGAAGAVGERGVSARHGAALAPGAMLGDCSRS